MEVRLAVLRGFTNRHVVVQFFINAPADSPVCAALQRHGRLARPPSPPVHVSAPVYNVKDNLLVCTVVQTPRPIHPSARMADSLVIDFSFTMVIINSAVIITDLTHQMKFIQYILYYILLSLKEQLLWLASSPVQDKLYH